MVPSKLTKELREAFVKYLSTGAYIKQVCEFLNLGESTVHLWLSRGRAEKNRLESNPRAKMRESERPYVEFLDEVTKASNVAEIRAVGHWQNAMGKDWRAARDFLARRYPDRWSQKIELTGADGGPLQVKLDVDVEELARKIQQLAEVRNVRAIPSDPPIEIANVVDGDETTPSST